MTQLGHRSAEKVGAAASACVDNNQARSGLVPGATGHVFVCIDNVCYVLETTEFNEVVCADFWYQQAVKDYNRRRFNRTATPEMEQALKDLRLVYKLLF